MSLAAEDGGDEQQNELRTLHSQLEITIKMVETLSRQLSDLKDQVCLIFLLCTHLLSIAIFICVL